MSSLDELNFVAYIYGRGEGYFKPPPSAYNNNDCSLWFAASAAFFSPAVTKVDQCHVNMPDVAEMSLPLLFSSAFLSSTLLPGGSEAVLLYMLREGAAAPLVLWAVASLGNILGGVSGWIIGWWAARMARGRRVLRNNHHYRRACMRLRRWGSPALLFSWLPVVGDPLCVAAGWLRVGFFSALTFIALGKAVRYGVLVLMAMPAP